MNKSQLNKNSDEECTDLLSLVFQTSAIVNSYVNDFFKVHHISRVQFRTLYILFPYGKEGISLSELSEKLLVSKPTITTLIDRMVNNDLVQRRSINKRSTNAVISEKGVKIMQVLLPLEQELRYTLFMFLDDEEKITLQKLLTKVIKNVESKEME